MIFKFFPGLWFMVFESLRGCVEIVLAGGKSRRYGGKSEILTD